MRKTLSPLLMFLMPTILFLSPATVFAKTEAGNPDLEREKRIALEVEDVVLDGDVIFLKDSSHKPNGSPHKFIAIDHEPEGDTKGGIIILHGRGFHPNWVDAIFPLRTQLPVKGWRTLSVQMPVLEKTAKYYDYVPLFPVAAPRIDAAIAYLKEQGVDNIVLFAHSCGAHMAMHWVRIKGNGLNESISAYIGAGMGATDYKQKMAEPFPLASMTIPILDIYGEKEFPAVLRMAPKRLAGIKQGGNKKSKQVIVSNADHYFKDNGDGLVEVVSNWLDSL